MAKLKTQVKESDVIKVLGPEWKFAEKLPTDTAIYRNEKLPGWAIEVWNNGTILIVDPTSTLKWIGNLNDKKSEEFFDKSAALNKRS